MLEKLLLLRQRQLLHSGFDFSKRAHGASVAFASRASRVAVVAHIRKNPHEVAAWREAGHTTFFLKAGWTNLSFWDQAQKFVKCFPEIIATADRAKSGTMFMVSVNGKITT